LRLRNTWQTKTKSFNDIGSTANRLQASSKTLPQDAQTTLADSGRCGAQRSEVEEEAAGRGTRTALSATPS